MQQPRSQMHDMLQENNKLILLRFSSKCAERLPIPKSILLQGGALAKLKIDFFVGRHACPFQKRLCCRAERLPISKSTFL
jgi:hypothetical protein